MSACASTQTTPISPPLSRRARAAPAIEPAPSEWSPPRQIGIRWAPTDTAVCAARARQAVVISAT